MTSRRVVIAGGNGFLGQSFAPALTAAGYDVDVLTRTPNRAAIGRQLPWDGATVGNWAEHVDGAVAIVNLTGKNVNCRYTPANRREIIGSRVRSVGAIADAIAACDQPPRVWIQASSLLFYGDTGTRVSDETAPPGTGFSPSVVHRWEAAFDGCEARSTRKVALRMGFVLSAGGGALQSLVRLARLGLGGRAGDGNQYISWLHVSDLNRMIQNAIDREDVGGTYNATGPEPVTNADFMATLRRTVHRPWGPPVPAWMLHVGAWMMRTEPELVLSGRRCVPRRWTDLGFEFRFPTLEPALRDLLGER